MIYSLYHSQIPPYVTDIMNTKIFRRLQNVGMNCGMEYTQFEPFCHCKGVSRYDHSIGTALITWHFTQDKEATVAALLHDISTPVFAHVIDFLNHDYVEQESTESLTREMIFGSEELQPIFERYEIEGERVADYHDYPIADNESPRLSADRLEYTLTNSYYYGLLSLAEIQDIYEDLIATDSEIVFQTPAKALRLAQAMLQCSLAYTSDANRYCMEYLARLIRRAIEKDILQEEELYTTEPQVIAKLCTDAELAAQWQIFCHFHRVDVSAVDKEGYWKINAKHRYFDPATPQGRIIEQDAKLHRQIEDFLNDQFDRYVKAF